MILFCRNLHLGTVEVVPFLATSFVSGLKKLNLMYQYFECKKKIVYDKQRQFYSGLLLYNTINNLQYW